MKKGEPDTTRKFKHNKRNNFGESANCVRGRHSVCGNFNCTCECHLGSAELARRRGLRTVAKPGDPDFKGSV